MRDKVFIVEDMTGEDSKPYALVRHGYAYEGKWQRRVLFVEGWFEKEDDARLARDRWNHP